MYGLVVNGHDFGDGNCLDLSSVNATGVFSLYKVLPPRSGGNGVVVEKSSVV